MKTPSQKLSILFAATITALSLLSNTAKAQKDSTNIKLSLPQKLNLKQYILPGATMFLSGALDGTIESISFHYQDGFKRALPHVNDQFWNPAISWTNKYKNGNQADGPKYIGSTTIFVAPTDAYHSLRTARNFLNSFTVAFYINRSCHETKKMSFRKFLTDALVLAAIRDIGFSATYSVLFKEAWHE
jgi:hypothetical protein